MERGVTAGFRICSGGLTAAASLMSRMRMPAPWAANLNAMACANAAARARDYGDFAVESKWQRSRVLPSSERNASLPGNEIFLLFHLSFRPDLAARHLDHEIENRFAHLINCLLAFDDRSGIDVDDVVHALGQAELVESFTTGAMGLPVGVPSPVVNKTTLAPAPTCAVTHSTSFPGVHCRLSPGSVEYSGIVEHRGHRRVAAFLGCSGGFHGVGQQSVSHVAGRRIHFESRIARRRPAPRSRASAA